MPPLNVQNYLKSTSENFRHTFREVGRVVKKVFPHSQEIFEYHMPGWKIATYREVPKNWRGTLDPRWMMILLVERKAGVTLHIWNPSDYYYLDKHKAFLTSAGFKVMRGCLQFNKKQAFPIEAVKQLLKKIKV